MELMRQDAAADDGLLQEAIDAYAKGFHKDPSHFLLRYQRGGD